MLTKSDFEAIQARVHKEHSKCFRREDETDAWKLLCEVRRLGGVLHKIMQTTGMPLWMYDAKDLLEYVRQVCWDELDRKVDQSNDDAAHREQLMRLQDACNKRKNRGAKT